MINVSNINKAKELNSAKTKKNVDGSSFSSYLNKTASPTSAQISGTAGISVADAIFATQMVNDEEEKEIRKKLCKRGATLLEKLEEIRDGLLLGHISKDQLIDISRMVKERRFETADTRLKEIIDEIELRVEVELAKLMR